MWCVSLSISMQEIARNCITQHHPGYIRRYKDIYSDLNWGDEFCFIVWCVSHRPPMGLPFNRRYAVSSHGPVVSALIFSNTWQHIVDVLLLSPVPCLAASTVFPSETEGCESTIPYCSKYPVRFGVSAPKTQSKTASQTDWSTRDK